MRGEPPDGRTLRTSVVGRKVRPACVEPRSEVSHDDTGAFAVLDLCLEDRGVGGVVLLGAHGAEEFDGEEPRAGVGVVVDQAAEHRVSIEARQTAPHYARARVHERTVGAVADDSEIEGGHESAISSFLADSIASVSRCTDSTIGYTVHCSTFTCARLAANAPAPIRDAECALFDRVVLQETQRPRGGESKQPAVTFPAEPQPQLPGADITTRYFTRYIPLAHIHRARESNNMNRIPLQFVQRCHTGLCCARFTPSVRHRRFSPRSSAATQRHRNTCPPRIPWRTTNPGTQLFRQLHDNDRPRGRLRANTTLDPSSRRASEDNQ